MNTKTYSLFLLGCLLSIIACGDGSSAEDNQPSEILDQACTIENLNCPVGYDCIDFPKLGTRCAKPDPCSYFNCPETKECALAESFPPRVICSGSCVGEFCDQAVDSSQASGI